MRRGTAIIPLAFVTGLDSSRLGKRGHVGAFAARQFFSGSSSLKPLLALRVRASRRVGSHVQCSGEPTTDAPYRVAVIGAGIAGGVCASRLCQLPGIATTVYDMGSRGPGGRACSRPVDGKGGSFSPGDRGGISSISALSNFTPLTFDHGVQAFSVNHEDVQELLQGWLRKGIVQQWEGRFGVLNANTGAFTERQASGNDDDPFALLRGRPRYVGMPSMSGFVSGLLERATENPESDAALTQLYGCKALNVTYNVEGHSVSGSRWTIKSSDAVDRHFDAVVVAGHSAKFAADVAAQLPVTDGDHALVLEMLRRVSYPEGASPLYALMVAFAEPLGARAPFDAAAIARSTELRWLSRDSSKPGRNRDDALELWVALSTEKFAQNIADEINGNTLQSQGGFRPTEIQLQQIATKLLAAMEAALHVNMPTPVYLHAQRWQAGITRAPLDIKPSPCVAWERFGLAACGDWAAASASVEEAARSGIAAADAIHHAYAAAVRMQSLFSKVPPPGADEHLKVRAHNAWPEWRCDAYPGSPSGLFSESRWWEAPGREKAAEERCLVTAGRAMLWLEGGGAPVEIAKGDWATFRRGFQCTWVVHEAIAKRYAYFDKDGHELPFT